MNFHGRRPPQVRSVICLPEQWKAEAGQPQDIGGVDGRGQLGQTGQELRGENRIKLHLFLTIYRFSYTIYQLCCGTCVDSVQPASYLNDDQTQLTLKQEQEALSDAVGGVSCLEGHKKHYIYNMYNHRTNDVVFQE